MTCSPAYASATVRQTFNRQSPVTRYTTVPASFVLIQRINLGLFALLGRLGATADWRRITEEIWPWVERAALDAARRGRGRVAGRGGPAPPEAPGGAASTPLVPASPPTLTTSKMAATRPHSGL